MDIPHIPLEDTYADIISKAQAGLGLADSDMVQLTGLDRQAVRSARRGMFSEADAQKLAVALCLNPQKLCACARKEWYPRQTAVEGLIPVTMPFPESGYEEMTVNAYIVQLQGSNEAILFDAGTRPEMMVQELLDRSLKPSMLFLTHAHRDHIGGYAALLETFPHLKLYAHAEEHVEGAFTVGDHQLFSFDNNLEISCLSTPGHSSGGISYFIKGMETPVVITGDAIFAGSIGGAANAYQVALNSIRENLLTLPNETIVCPGHGPMTSIAEEKEHNPFFIL